MRGVPAFRSRSTFENAVVIPPCFLRSSWLLWKYSATGNGAILMSRTLVVFDIAFSDTVDARWNSGPLRAEIAASRHAK